MTAPPAVTVFGSARAGHGSPDYVAAEKVGALLARLGYTVCNGGYGGTMEASARGARDAGGTVVGVTVAAFDRTPNAWITTVIERPTLLGRMMTLLEMGSGYIILPGGTGTLLELAALWEFMNKGLLAQRPAVALGAVWHPVVAAVQRQLREEGYEEGARLIRVEETPEACVSVLHRHLKGATA